METIHVKFNELTAMASEHDSLEPVLQCFINDDSSAESMNTPSKEDLDNLFEPMYDEYLKKKSFDMPINNQEDSSLTSSYDIEAHEAPPIVTTSKEQNSPISLIMADEFNQEDSAELNGNTLLTLYDASDFSKAESSTNLDPSNIHGFHQVQPSTHIWTKAHPLEQVIDDPSKHVMTRHRLQTNPKEEGIDFEESFAPFARLEAVRIFIAFAAHKNITVFQRMLKKALYGLKQAPRPWYDKLSLFLLEHHFTKGLQVHQSPRGIFISQTQYAIEMLKKHGTDECVSMSTPMATERLDDNLQGTPTDQMTYRRMIRGLMYLTASCSDIAFATFVCARYQACPTAFFAMNRMRIIIMAQSQRPADVHQDELCPPNKRYALMDANKKVDLENTLCPNESRILANIPQNHPLGFSIAASSLVPWIYLGQTIFHLPQATNNNHDQFVPDPKFSEMVPFYINNLGFTLELRSTSLRQLVFYNCGRHCAKLLWEGFHNSLKNPTTRISYPRFTKLIMRYYMTIFPKISRRSSDRYHNLEDDVMIKSIFNSGKSKNVVWNEDSILDDNRRNEDTLQISLAKKKSHKELDVTNVKKVKEHLMAKEIEKLVEGTKNVEENVVVVSSPFRNDDNQTNPNTRLKPKSDKESLEVEKIADISEPVNVIKEKEESAEDDYELKRREKGKHFMPRRKFNALAQHLQDIMMESLTNMVDERIKKILQTQVPLHVAQGIILEKENSQAKVAKMIADTIQQERKNFQSEISSQVNDAITNHIPSQVDSSVKSYMLGHDDLPIWLALKYKIKRLYMATTLCNPLAVRPRDQDDPHDDARPEGENSNQDQSDDFGFWTNSYASDDDVLPNEKVSQELVDEMSQTVDEAKLHKVVDEMLRQQCTSGDEHQYHIDQMQNFLKSDIVWKIKKEIIVPPYQPKPTSVV
nr:hypothetical protein [Tanacetum cinerariifolium]